MNGKELSILLGVWATFALDVYSAFNSSPQTTEINAKTRADTLLKWVYIGDGVALAGGILGTYVSKNPAPLLATTLVVVSMHMLYLHAKKAGLASEEQGTESY